MPVITTANSKKLINSLDTLSLAEIDIKVYKMPIFFLNKKDESNLKGIREFFRAPEQFKIKYYKPIVVVDSYKYLYPEKQPSYHKDILCDRLKSNFANFKIPKEINGKENVLKFRIWYKKHSYLLEENKKEFLELMNSEFNISKSLESIDINNSKSNSYVFESLKEIESQIDKYILESGAFFNNSDFSTQNIIKRFQKLTFLAYYDSKIYNNDTSLTDDELRLFLKKYDDNFKNPVKELLVEYYRYYHNPNMTFDDNILEAVGFKPCIKCYQI
jgi:hypothetical protein